MPLRDEHEEHVEGGEVRERRDLDGLVDVHIGLADARDDSDCDVARIERRKPGRAASGGDDQVVLPDDLVLRDEIENQRFSGSLAVADEAVSPGVGVAAGDGFVGNAASTSGFTTSATNER